MFSSTTKNFRMMNQTSLIYPDTHSQNSPKVPASLSRFQAKLIELARATIDFDEWKKAYHVSFLTRGRRIESIGVNSPKKTHSLSLSYGNYVHSEIHAITKYRNWVSELRKCELWNVRINKDHCVSNSKPCAACQKVIEAFGIKRVYYSVPGGIFEEF